MDILKKYIEGKGLINIVKQGEQGLKRAKFDLLKLKNDHSYAGNTGNDEIVLVLISGKFDAKGPGFEYKGIKRSSVFKDKPAAVYLPINTDYKIESASDDLEIAVCSSRAELKAKSVLITPENVREFDLGVLSWKRKANFIIDERVESENFFIGETFLPPGGWAFPPHRHDYNNYPEEIEMDEIYHYRVNPSNGFGVQLFYTDDKSSDNAYTVRNGDTCIFPEGYHPAAASPADSLYILWFLSGKKRYFLSRPDDQYKWVVNCENLIK